MSKIIGIDLGTTNTVAAVVEGGEPRIIPTENYSAMLRSVVAITPDGRWLVGNTAHNQAVANPTNTVYSIKRLMGRDYDDDEVQELRRRNRYSQITEGAKGKAMVRLGEQDYRPEQIAAMILSRVKANAERYLNEPVHEAVISIPANADHDQRQATLRAGHIAGLSVTRLIHEPTAIGLAYRGNQEQHGLIAVYDMGGGTFDLSFMQLQEGELEVLRTAGRPFLGGDDFDEHIIQWLRTEFENAHNTPLMTSPAIERLLAETSETMKINLSQEQNVRVQLPFIDRQYSLDLILSREALQEMVNPLIQKSLDYCTFLRDELNLHRQDFDAVLMAGGMSHMPYIKQQVATHFGQEPQVLHNPEQAVALGAALQGGIQAGEVRDVLLLDVTPLTLSIRKEGGLAEPFIERNTTIPVSETKIVTTAEDSQNHVTISVYQGERPLVEGNWLMGKFTLHDIPPAPRGAPQIEVTFQLDQSGMLFVSAHDLDTGRTGSIRITESSGIDEVEIQRMLEETQHNADVDRARQADIEARTRRKEEYRRAARRRFGTGQLDAHQRPFMFLSYAHIDGFALARRLEADLAARGFTVFWDHGIRPEGADIGVMEFAIEQADLMLALMTPDAPQTDYLKRGWQYAINHCHKSVIPLLAAGFDPQHLPPILTTAQPIDLRRGYTQALDALEHYLKAFWSDAPR